MRALSHTVTGAVIGIAVQNPAVAVAAALSSHFLLDLMPHYGIDDHVSRKFRYVLIGDAILTVAFLLAVLILLPGQWLVPVGCGILAASPDLIWLPYWLQELKGRAIKYDPVSDFLIRIQWCERPWGILVEIAWVAAMLVLFFRLR